MDITPYMEAAKRFLQVGGYHSTSLEAIDCIGEVFKVVFRDLTRGRSLFVIVALEDKRPLGFWQTART